MTIVKNYTDLSQSKTLSKILSLESADGGWYGTTNPLAANTTFWLGTNYSNKAVLPAWSLAALLGILTENKICHYDNRYYCQHISEGGEFPFYSTAEYDNPIDACVAMIEKLHELKML